MNNNQIKPFKETSISTCTILAYTNMLFDLDKFINSIDLFHYTINSTDLTKKGIINKKKIRTPYGTIWHARYADDIRGVILPKKNKRKPKNNDIKVDVTKRRTGYFRNQVMIELSLGLDRGNVNIMLFKNHFKIAGCKQIDQAKEVVNIIWNKYINPSNCWEVTAKGETNPTIVIEEKMKNRGFRFDFNINRSALNTLMNDEKYRNFVNKSSYDATNATNVKIEMYIQKPEEYKMDIVEFKKDETGTYIPEWYETTENNYANKKREKDATFLAFSSGQVNVSGRYDEYMEKLYDFFVSEVYKHRDQVMEQINL